MAKHPEITPQDVKDAEDSLLSPLYNEMAEHGLTSEYLILKLIDELDAQDTKFAQEKGVFTDQKNVTAWQIRQRARQDAHKLRGDYPPTQISGPNGGPIPIHTEISDEERAVLKEHTRRIAQLEAERIAKKEPT